MNSNRWVALDIGGVCISIHMDRVCRQMGIPDVQSAPKNLLRMAYLLEIGKCSEEEFLTAFSRAAQGRYSVVRLREIWNMILGDPVPGMKEAVAEYVRKGFRFIYFSNTSSIHMTHFLRNNDWCHLISGAVFSYEIGCAKPDPAAYRAFETRYGTPAAYFDDTPVNIEAGIKMGWNSVRFTSPADLTRALDPLLNTADLQK